MLSFKVLFVVSCLVMLAKSQLPEGGVIEELSGEELQNAELQLKDVLSKLVRANYTIGKINSATRQSYLGSLYTYKADLVDEKNDTKNCETVVWSREVAVLVFIQCDGALPVFEQQNA